MLFRFLLHKTNRDKNFCKNVTLCNLFMSLYSVAKIHNYNFSGYMLDCKVGTKNIWAITSNGFLMLIHRDNIEKFTLIPMYTFGSVPPKLIIDAGGDKCAVIYDTGKTYFISSPFQQLNELTFPQNIVPCCGTWVHQEGKRDTLILCSDQGAVLQVWPGYCERCGFLYYSQTPKKIEEIHILLGKVNFIFMVLKDRILYMAGEDPFEILFSKASEDNNFILPSIEGRINQRLFASFNDEGLAEAAALFIPGFITFVAQKAANGKISFKQDLYDEKTRYMTCLMPTPWGVLEALRTEVRFFSTSRTIANFAFPDICFMHYDKSEIIIGTNNQLVVFSVDDFRKAIANEAVNQGDFDFAREIGGESFNPNEMIVYKISKLTPKEGARFLLDNDWRLDEIIHKFGERKELILYVLKEVLSKINYNRTKHRSAVSFMIISIYSQMYPQHKDEFEDFIRRESEYINAQQAYKLFEEYGATEMIEKLAYIKNDRQKLISYYIDTENSSNALILIENEFCPSVVMDTLIRILHFAKRDVSNFLTVHTTYNITDLIPLLLQIPETAVSYASSYYLNSNADALLFLSLCKLNRDAQITQKVLYGCENQDFVLRLCLSFGCKEAASHIWLDLGRIDKAVETMYQIGYEKTVELLSTTFSQEHKRTGWLKLLQIASKDDKMKVLDEVLNQNLFTFDEIIDFVDDSEKTYMFTDLITDASEKIKSTTDSREYKKTPPPQQLNDLSLTMNSECSICGERLYGTRFYEFPCGHCVHENCVKSYIRELVNLGLCGEDCLEDLSSSCPCCGFLSLLSINNPM